MIKVSMHFENWAEWRNFIEWANEPEFRRFAGYQKVEDQLAIYLFSQECPVCFGTGTDHTGWDCDRCMGDGWI